MAQWRITYLQGSFELLYLREGSLGVYGGKEVTCIVQGYKDQEVEFKLEHYTDYAHLSSDSMVLPHHYHPQSQN